MVIFSLIILVIICVLVSILWFKKPSARKFIKDNGPLFSAIATLIALTVFIQFYRDNQEKSQEEMAKHNSKMVALGSEIINNVELCNLFEAEKEGHLKGVEVPNIFFEYSVMSSMIMNGDITHHKLRAELTSLKAQMESINRLIQTQQQLMIFKSFAPLDRQEALKQRTIVSMLLLHSKTPLIRQQLAATEPLFKEFWNNPEKYMDESYLKNNMLPEALIR